MNNHFLLMGGFFLFSFNELFVSDAFAYLDPGTGTMIIQSLIGALVAAGIILKVYWIKIKHSILERKSKSKSD
jgi:hypothetical protein